MATITFSQQLAGKEIRFVVIAAREKAHWLLARHRARQTWEIPGGHVEPGESPLQAAKRELWEETGVTACDLEQICVYSAAGQDISKDGYTQSYGVLFYAKVQARGPLPPSEIAEVKGMQAMPPLEQLTYPLIQPALLARVEEFCRQHGEAV